MRLTKNCPMKLLAASVIAASLGTLPACGGCLEVSVTQPPSSETAKAMEDAAKVFVDGIIQKDWSAAASSVSPAVRQGVSRTLKDPGAAFEENEALAGIRKRLLSLKDDVEKDGNRLLSQKNGSGREKFKMDENALPLVRCSGSQLGLTLQSGGSYGGSCEVVYEQDIGENTTISVSSIVEVTFVADASGRWLLDSFALRGETSGSHYMRYTVSADGIQLKSVEMGFLERQALRGVLALERALAPDAERSE